MDIKDLQNDVQKISDDDLKNITDLAEKIKEYTRLISNTEEQLKSLKQDLKILQEGELPSRMLGVGMQEFKLISGEKISIKKVVTASITKSRKDQALQWLDDNGFGDLIKTEIKLKFDKGEQEKATGIFQKLDDLNLNPIHDKSVHYQTLVAFVKEQLAEGVELPHDLLGIYTYEKAIID